jgi:hypothetical protein
MRRLHLSADDPLNLTISADARFSTPDYTSDITWTLNPGAGEPPALALESTLGLRALSLRLFPRFLHGFNDITNPVDYYRVPVVEQILPGYLRVDFAPLPGIAATAEYWITASGVAAGRLHLLNWSVLPESFRVEWLALLRPLPEGQSFAALPVDKYWALQGCTGGLTLALWAGEAATPSVGTLPGLGVDVDLPPGSEMDLPWTLAAQPDFETGLDLARRQSRISWDAQIARMELIHAGQVVEFETGNADWDTALLLAQVNALRLFFPPGGGLPNPSFVLTRQPDYGHSLRIDGSDYPPLWRGQTALDAWYLASLLPGVPELGAGLVENFLACQEEDGRIDWRPGLGGQRTRHLAQPMLATLAARLEPTRPAGWIDELYPALMKFIRRWFAPDVDRDHDGYPEWSHPLQTGLEAAPLYNRWHADAEGVGVELVETPALGALLYRECRSLIPLATRLKQRKDLAWLRARTEHLRRAVEQAWDEKAGIYRYRDLQSHASPAGQELLRFNGPGVHRIRRKLRSPQRLVVCLKIGDEPARDVVITLRGMGARGRVSEEFTARQLDWLPGCGRAVSQTLFTTVETIEVRGLPEDICGVLRTPDYQQEDLSLLLPLWAGIPSPERAKVMLKKALQGRYLQPWGLPVCPPVNRPADPVELACVSMIWNQLLGEGLLRYGYRVEAADLTTRLLNGAVAALRQTHGFRGLLHAETGEPLGETNRLRGLPPVGLFLQTAGLLHLAPGQVILQNSIGFSMPITVQYRGMRITLKSADSVVTFARGQTLTVSGPDPHRVTLSGGEK